MIEIRKATQEDLDYVRENPLEEAVKNYPHFTLKDYAKTGIIDGRIMGVGGVIVHWAGFGEGWLILSKEVSNFKVEAYFCIKELVEKAISDLSLRRLEANVRLDFPQTKKMIEKLGFKMECVKESYFPDGSNSYQYSRIIK